LISVFLAWKGLGITSFTWAVLGRSIVGLILIYLISPWRPAIAFSSISLAKLLKFGIPYQANTFMAVVKDDLMTIFLGKVIGSTGLGYLGWAKKWAEQPLRFFMDNVSKVAFPTFSRLQDDKQRLKISVEKSLFFLSFLTFPILTGFSLLASDLIKVIPRYLKWQPALLALYLYSFNSAWATISTSMTNLLNAIGKIKTTFKLMIMWLILTWILIPIGGFKLGFNGVAMAAAIISFSSLVAIIVAKRQVNFDLSNTVGKPLLASFLMGITMYLGRITIGNLLVSLGFRILIGFFSYLLFSYLLIGRLLFDDIAKIYHEIRKNR